jgi:hypothetical protein
MRRPVLGVLAALVLVILVGGGVAVAGPPVAPEIAGVATRWGMIEWDDGIARCTLVADAALDPGFARGAPVVAHAYAHFMWVGDGGGTWQEFNYWNVRLSRGDTSVHTYTSFGGDTGYYVVDRVRFDLTSGRGALLSSKTVSTTNTCMNG